MNIEEIFPVEGIRENLDESIGMIHQGVEPYFFIFESEVTPVYRGTSINSREDPISTLFRHLGARQDMPMEELQQTYERLLTLKATAHFHTDQVIEPSPEDFDIMNRIDTIFTAEEIEPPRHIIGRYYNHLDMILLKKVESINVKKIRELPMIVEKNIVLYSLPRYFGGDLPIVSRLSKLAPREFFQELKKISSSFPQREFRKHVEEFQTDFTVFPEYVGAVVDAVRQQGIYDAAPITYIQG